MAAEGGCMTTDLMVNHYIPEVLVPGAAAARLVHCSKRDAVFPVVIHDKHASHIAPATLDKFAASQLEPIALPGGFTLVLQPMDVSINKPFKQFMWKLYVHCTNCILSSVHTLTYNVYR